MNNILQMINQYASNPMMLFQRFNIPTSCNSPDSVMNYLMQSGRVSQAQINQAQSLYRQIFNK